MGTFRLSLSLFAARYRHYRMKARTKRILGELSPAILRDIGWPDMSEWNDRR